MSHTVARPGTSHRIGTRSRLADRLARSLVLKRLARIEHGHLLITEGKNTHAFGSVDPTVPAVRMRVNNPRFYRQIATGGSLAAADGYIDGVWSCDDLVGLFRLLLRNAGALRALEGGLARLALPLARAAHFLRRNSRGGSRRNIHAHYDLGNELFALFLDDTLTYSCGIFESPESTLREASVAKLDRICRKLSLGPEDHVLEIGTGWGSFALHAAGNFGCRVTTTTISREQHDLAARRIRAAGLEERIELLLRDYRDLEGQFDKVVSIEMIEAVGHRFLGTYLERCSRLLRPDGTLLIQGITMSDQRYDDYLRSVDFIQKRIFPGSCLPALSALTAAMKRHTDLRLTHLEDITSHYPRTLRTWRENFLDKRREVRDLGYPPEFERLWEYYLAYCEAGFLERHIGTLQLLFAKPQARISEVLPPRETLRPTECPGSEPA